MQKIIPEALVKILSLSGVALYASVGIVSMLMGGRFLDYSSLLTDKITAQETGVMIVEFGIGITVFAVIMMLFYCFAQRSPDAE